jgi:RNA polymerase sigma factor (sigma-70 family)
MEGGHVECEFSFESEWRSTSELLRGALERRGVPHSFVDDLIQETGLRLLQRWDMVDPERGTWPLAFTVAMNILKDQIRADVRRQNLVLPAPRTDDPEVVALARVELDEVRQALNALSGAQRDALLAEVGDANGNGRTPAAEKMLRMRARKRLRMLTRDGSTLAGWLELSLQRLAERVHTTRLPLALEASTPFAAGLISLAMFTGVSSVGLEEPTLPDGTDRRSAASSVAAVVDLEDAVNLATGGPARSDSPALTIRFVRSATTSSAEASHDGEREGGHEQADDRARGQRPTTGTHEVPETEPAVPDALGGVEPATPEPPPVSIEPREPTVEPGGEGATAGADADAAGNTASMNVSVRPQSGNGDTASLPTVEIEGGAQLDGEGTVELG